MSLSGIDFANEAAKQQPLSKFETRCDDKGRIRLPANWLHFFTHILKDTKVFCTSLDGTTIRIYGESLWRENLAIFEQNSDLSTEVEHIITLANHYGSESDLDATGRILISSELRTELNLLGDVVVGTGRKGVIHLHQKADYANLISNAKLGVQSSIQILTQKGMR